MISHVNRRRFGTQRIFKVKEKFINRLVRRMQNSKLNEKALKAEKSSTKTDFPLRRNESFGVVIQLRAAMRQG